nr:tetratricopeptide repeat protein [Sedimentitalea sp. CY04]
MFPGTEQLWTIRGASALTLGQLELAEKSFRQSVKLKPGASSSHSNLGNALDKLGRHSEAVECFSKAMEMSPPNADLIRSRAGAHQKAGDLQSAMSDIQESLKLEPENAKALSFLGQTLAKLGDFESAIAVLEASLRLDPSSSIAKYDLGTAYLKIGNVNKARVYVEQSVASNPTCASSLVNLSWVQFQTKQYDAAVKSSLAAIALDSRKAKAYECLANVQQYLGEYDMAVAAYSAATLFDNTLHAAQTQKMHFQAQMCEWSAYDEFETVAEAIGITGDPVAPWPLLGFEDNPARQKVRSAKYAKSGDARRTDLSGSGDSSRIRIGYFSSDLSNHATLFLLNGVFEHHNQSDFEIFVYCLNEPKANEYLDRLVQNTEHFVDLHMASDDEIVERARQDNLDIAIDLKGYTQDARTGPFYAGVAPIQINYLGYLGTMATSCMDYMIADPVVVPPEQREHYSENLIYLPDSYQPNDDKRAISQVEVTRATYGLSDDAVVLCCFNASYKITPTEFDIWMRVLSSVPNTVLWLLDTNKWAKENLKKAARDRGIDDSRLVFCDRAASEVHLARHRLADIFVDTFNVNAHTTASDALWSGLPVVTKVGSQFAARVAASLLNAVDMADLVVETAQQYEEMITNLASDKSALAKVKARLQSNLKTAPLYDTAAYTRHLEEGYRKVYQTWKQGEAKQDVHVETTVNTV